MAGKGDTFRTVVGEVFRENFDRAFTVSRRVAQTERVPGCDPGGEGSSPSRLIRGGLTGVDPRATLQTPDPSGV